MTKKIKLALLAKRNECNKRQCVFLTTAAVVLLFFESRPSPMISASDLDIGNVKRACGAVRSSSSSAAVAPRSIAGAGSTTALALQREKWAAAIDSGGGGGCVDDDDDGVAPCSHRAVQ